MEPRQRPNEIQADWIRRFVRANFDSLATRQGDEFTIRAGDVADGMSLRDRMPNICQVLRGKKLRSFAGLDLRHQHGPKAGRTAEFVYKKLGAPRP